MVSDDCWVPQPQDISATPSTYPSFTVFNASHKIRVVFLVKLFPTECQLLLPFFWIGKDQRPRKISVGFPEVDLSWYLSSHQLCKT